jgi:hypothetical protein
MGLAIGECAAMDTAVVILLAQLFLDGRSRAVDFLDGRFQFVRRYTESLRRSCDASDRSDPLL